MHSLGRRARWVIWSGSDRRMLQGTVPARWLWLIVGGWLSCAANVQAAAAAANAMAQNQAAFGRLASNAAALQQAVASANAVAAQMGNANAVNAAAVQALGMHSKAFANLAQNPQAFAAIASNPQAFAALSNHPQAFAAMSANPQAFAQYSGNVAASELVRRGMLDALSSDYVPASLLQAAFLLRHGFGLPMSEAMAPVTRNPARLLGLTDRGAIAPGLRADLVRVREVGATPTVVGVWVAGERIA